MRPKQAVSLARGSSFNGATTLRSWNDSRLRELEREEPELQWGHDPEVVEWGRCFSVASAGACFNGATALRSWNGRGWGRAALRCECFNGATTLRSGNARQPRASWRSRRWLQWGHDPEVVECRSDEVLRRFEERFNGATTLRSWNVGNRRRL